MSRDPGPVLAVIPFGGFKQWGFGSDMSLHALDKHTGLKTTWIRY